MFFFNFKFNCFFTNKTKNFPLCPENINSPQDKFKKRKKVLKPVEITQNRKLICDWTVKKNYLILFKMLKFCIKNEMVVNQVDEVISFRQSKWLEKFINFDTQKNRARNDFETNL